MGCPRTPPSRASRLGLGAWTRASGPHLSGLELPSRTWNFLHLQVLRSCNFFSWISNTDRQTFIVYVFRRPPEAFNWVSDNALISGFGKVPIYRHCCWTHWGWDKMAAILLIMFLKAFSWMKMYDFLWKVPIDNIPALVQIMAWGPFRCQTIIWTNDGWFTHTDAYVRHSVSMSYTVCLLFSQIISSTGKFFLSVQSVQSITKMPKSKEYISSSEDSDEEVRVLVILQTGIWIEIWIKIQQFTCIYMIYKKFNLQSSSHFIQATNVNSSSPGRWGNNS